MKSAMVPDEDVLDTIAEYYEKYGYLLDPHSAIGVAAANKVLFLRDEYHSRDCLLLSQVTTDAKRMVSLACAHWGKFPVAVERAIGQEEMSKLELPKTLAELGDMQTRKYAIENETVLRRD